MNESIAGAPTGAIHRLFNHAGLRRFLVRTRIPLALAAAVWLVFNIRPEWFWPGLAVSGVGEALQLWCFGALHKQRDLAINGPYRLVRNPMYLARYLLVAGCLLFLGSWPVLVGFTVAYYFYMVNRVRREEARLTEVFGEPYLAYCRQVSRFLPFAGIYPGGRLWFFRWDYFAKNHGPRNALLQGAFYVACYLLTFRPFA